MQRACRSGGASARAQWALTPSSITTNDIRRNQAQRATAKRTLPMGYGSWTVMHISVQEMPMPSSTLSAGPPKQAPTWQEQSPARDECDQLRCGQKERTRKAQHTPHARMRSTRGASCN